MAAAVVLHSEDFYCAAGPLMVKRPALRTVRDNAQVTCKRCLAGLAKRDARVEDPRAPEATQRAVGTCYGCGATVPAATLVEHLCGACQEAVQADETQREEMTLPPVPGWSTFCRSRGAK